MAQGLIGADVEDLRKLSQLMDTEAEKISGLQRELTALIRNGHYWKGNDAERFRSQWNGDLARRLGAAAECLKANAKTLRLNATQQELASRGDAFSVSSSYSDVKGFTADLGSVGPFKVDAKGSQGVEGKSEAHGSVGPDGVEFGASANGSAGSRFVVTGSGEFGPVKTSTTNETFVGARGDGSVSARVPFGFNPFDPVSLQAKGEGFVGAENITTTKSDFFDGWVNTTSTARAMTGVDVSAHANSNSPFLFGGGGEAFAGQKLTVENETDVAGGLLGFGQGTEVRAGAWASAGEAEVSKSKADGVTGSAASAGAGAELTQSQYVEFLGQRLTASGTVAAGAGEGYTVKASMDEDGLTLGIGAKVTAELGLGGGGEVRISPSGFKDSVTGFIDFLKN
ncbi:WXG100 family type VII secretion target [Paenarthrobacter sp. NPDC089675]|uniref:WXG100 family type VII secretion target n=1 Tax=Paenarthrobacter sp. NPDC089675 TaxID=3364376 RepID=UPI00381F271B